jgi:hypothetical protein
MEVPHKLLKELAFHSQQAKHRAGKRTKRGLLYDYRAASNHHFAADSYSPLRYFEVSNGALTWGDSHTKKLPYVGFDLAA